MPAAETVAPRARDARIPVVGTAGWAIPRASADRFKPQGSALQRYASRFAAVEINSSFYRSHRQSTWERWRNKVPVGFRFAVKIPKVISHERRLVDCAEPVARFLEEVGALGDKLAILLLQLPPKAEFVADVAEPFLRAIAGNSRVRIVCEPRHPSWFEDAPDALLRRLEVARAAADPAITAAAACPGGWRGLRYHRLHGSPGIYRTSYGDGRLEGIARSLLADGGDAPVWCMFDNTASGAAAADGLDLIERLAELRRDGDIWQP